MRLVEAIEDIVPGMSARGLRIAHPDDWYFQGHFPGVPVMPGVIRIEGEVLADGVEVATGSVTLADVAPRA